MLTVKIYNKYIIFPITGFYLVILAQGREVPAEACCWNRKSCPGVGDSVKGSYRLVAAR